MLIDVFIDDVDNGLPEGVTVDFIISFFSVISFISLDFSFISPNFSVVFSVEVTEISLNDLEVFGTEPELELDFAELELRTFSFDFTVESGVVES